MSLEGNKKIAKAIECKVNGVEKGIVLTENDFVFVTNGSCTEGTIYGDQGYAGMFPTWLCPEQVRVIPISEKFHNYAAKVEAQLKENGIRCSVDQRSEKMGYKIREARLARVPYMLIVGAKEEEEGKVSVRSRYLGDEGMKDLGEFLTSIKEEIKNKTIRKIEVQEENK